MTHVFTRFIYAVRNASTSKSQEPISRSAPAHNHLITQKTTQTISKCPHKRPIVPKIQKPHVDGIDAVFSDSHLTPNTNPNVLDDGRTTTHECIPFDNMHACMHSFETYRKVIASARNQGESNISRSQWTKTSNRSHQSPPTRLHVHV